MRGLKRLQTGMEGRQLEVASFTDAWIETRPKVGDFVYGESHLLQMRGLKRYHINEGKTDREVASFTDAWIETPVQPVVQIW